MRVRRRARRWPSLYYGVSLALWVQLLMTIHVTFLGLGALIALQLVIHEAWPRKYRRHKKSIGDRATDRIHRVL